jgi:hypothetical protein
MILSGLSYSYCPAESERLVGQFCEVLILMYIYVYRVANLDGGTVTVSLVRSEIRLSSDTHMQLLQEPAFLTIVMPTTNKASTQDKVLRIRGIGSEGSTSIDLYYNPAIYKQAGFEVGSLYTLPAGLDDGTVENAAGLQVCHYVFS